MSQAVPKESLGNRETDGSGKQEKRAITPPPLNAGPREYIGIFLTAASVLLLELALTRVFAVILWAHLAFMVVSTALFGFGLSGVYLALRPQKPSEGLHKNLTRLCLYISASIIAAYLIVTNVPFQMWQFQENPLNFVYLGVWYTALIAPFFFAGLVIARLLKHYAPSSSKLYGVDLVGAGVGSFLLIPVIGQFGGEGTVVFAALIAILAGLSFLPAGDRGHLIMLAAAGLALLLVLPKADIVLPLKLHQNKRRFNQALEHEHLISTRWSPLSRVDVSYHRKGLHDIWIDGGTNESVIIQWSGDMETLEPQTWSSIGAVYDLKQGSGPEVLIIGPAGGKEVLFALSYGASNVDAVEMDPSIVALVNEPKHAEYMGNLYQKDQVNLVNDEGRSFLRRQADENYDIIQIINNYTPVAIASGALNLSSAFLLTKEAFHDYLDKLRPGGVLALHRGATLRLAIAVMEVLHERGIEDPAAHLLISAGEVPYFDGFFLKTSPWTQPEIDKIYEYLKHRQRIGARGVFYWNPLEREGDSLYHTVLNSQPDDLVQYYTKLGVNLFPPTDNQPFVEHFLQFGKRDLSKELPFEFRSREKQKWRGLIPRGDFPYVAILVESILLSLLFVVAPLYYFAGSSIKTKNFSKFIGYFCCLGFAFIVVEICLMKKYVLFLGNPAYSITTVLVVILCGAGLGSIFSGSLGKYLSPKNSALAAISSVVGVLLLEMFVAPAVFSEYLALGFTSRVAIAAALLFPVGFVMGMPFPLGLQLIRTAVTDSEEQQKITAWAWGVNGYMTVVGSATTIFLALFAGFKAALLLGALTYLLGAVCIKRLSDA